ncbi:MAG: phenylacetate-CoA oxygenase/reductase subunit PaaK [Bacteroidetes bacterium]|nr:phenylacetate-CoA oxygenase/reductase subunit PaaK [Bacteroidota bacterium]
MATHFHALRVKDVHIETSDCVSIAFDIPEDLRPAFHFTQGQNITLRAVLDGQEVRRSYSICSAPSDNELRVAVKKVDKGLFSTFANHTLKTGDTLEIMPPSGRFYTTLNPAHKKNYLAFAAGSGITPILSIIKTTLATEPNSSFTLVYGNRNRASIIFREQLEALKNRYTTRFVLHHVLSREKTDAPINHGRIDREKCNDLGRKLIDVAGMDEIFLCGPEEMIFSVKEGLEQQGVPSSKIHFELFTTPGQKKQGTGTASSADASAVAGKTSRVTVKLDGISFDFDLPYNGLPILDAALQQGADLPYACKGGVCCTCRARLTSGEVEMDTNYALEPDELKEGFILTCQSHPRTEKVTIDFDQK